MKVNTWVEKWSQMNILDEKCKSYIQTECSTSGKMYGLIKTHKNNNAARIITSGGNTAIIRKRYYMIQLVTSHLELNTLDICLAL